MTVRVNFELDESDLRHFQVMMQQAREAGRSRSCKEVLDGARQLIATVRRVNTPEFVRRRIDQLETMIAMLEDREWQLGEEDAERVLTALLYFSEPEDLVPDHVPALGFLDDAIMIELLARELHHELDAYRDFCAFRAAEQPRRSGGSVTREDWLTAKREELHARMHRRRRREALRRWTSLFDFRPRKSRARRTG